MLFQNDLTLIVKNEKLIDPLKRLEEFIQMN